MENFKSDKNHINNNHANGKLGPIWTLIEISMDLLLGNAIGIDKKSPKLSKKTADKNSEILRIAKDLSQKSSTSLFTPNSNYPTPVKPRGKIFNLVPKLVQTKEKSSLLNNKEPRFVPFEPCKFERRLLLDFLFFYSLLKKSLSFWLVCFYHVIFMQSNLI